MTVLPQLERDLVDAAEKRLARAATRLADAHRASALPASTRMSRRLRPRGLRLALLVGACLLATATAGLAASGILLTGSPVPPSGTTNPNFGLGVPTRNGVTLLPLRIPDPEGGPPWGMRIVTTSRGESCIQIGRVHDGQIGELGIDGAFHNDRRFHRIPANALPAVAGDGTQPTMGAHTNCRLPGKAVAGESRVDRSAAGFIDPSHATLRESRVISYGVLGPQAVSIAYEEGGRKRTERVLPRLGAYLVVQRPTRKTSESWGATASLGTYGRLQASGAVTAITYRLDGKLCERGRPQPPGAQQHLPHECPFFHVKPSERPPAKMPDLHKKLNVHLSFHKHAVKALHVSFAAPYAIHSAKWEYQLEVPSCTSQHYGRFRSSTSVVYPGSTLQRDVAKGETIRFTIPNPFGPRACRLRPLTVDVVYRHAESPARTLVGSATLPMPPGDKPFDAAPHRTRKHHPGARSVTAKPHRTADAGGSGSLSRLFRAAHERR